MALYPTTLPISYGGTQDLETDRQLERASNGSLRGRMFYTGPKSVFKFNHDFLTSTQLTSFKSFYTINSAISFTFTWPGDGVTYTCIFASEPKYTATPYGVAVSVEISEI